MKNSKGAVSVTIPHKKKYKRPKKRFVNPIKNLKYEFYIFHANANTISLTSISNRGLKMIYTKAAVKPKNLLFRALNLLFVFPFQRAARWGMGGSKF